MRAWWSRITCWQGLGWFCSCWGRSLWGCLKLALAPRAHGGGVEVTARLSGGSGIGLCMGAMCEPVAQWRGEGSWREGRRCLKHATASAQMSRASSRRGAAGVVCIYTMLKPALLHYEHIWRDMRTRRSWAHRKGSSKLPTVSLNQVVWSAVRAGLRARASSRVHCDRRSRRESGAGEEACSWTSVAVLR